VGLVALIIGLILIVSAVRNSQDALFTALGQDAPKFLVWAAAIIAVGAIGYIPGLRTTSRLLLGLIIVVLIVNNYQKLITGFSDAWQNTGATPTGTHTTPTATAAPSSATSSSFWNEDFNSVVKGLL
jgi:uncharacterized membrane protein HdeD (DUF308 family)